MAKQRFTRFTVRIDADRTFDMGGFLDMLRYEGSTVRGWNRDGGAYSVDLLVDAHRYTPDRWRSFGIVPTQVDEDVYL